MIYAIICLACAIIAGYANSVMDKLSHHYSRSTFSKKKNQQYWNPSLSWRNKYKNGDPKQGAKFFGSTTFLVFTTDAWHFYKWILLSVIPIPGAIIIGFTAWGHWLVFVAGYVVLRAAFVWTFHLFYHWVWGLKEGT